MEALHILPAGVSGVVGMPSSKYSMALPLMGKEALVMIALAL
jgi:hypothetical protein